MTRTRRSVIAMLVAVALLAVVQGGGGSRASSAAVIRLQTSNATPVVGDIIVVSVRIRGAENVGSAPFMLTYDPHVLEFLPGGSREGSFLRGGDASTAFIASAGRAPGGVTGVSVGLARLGARRGARGYGILCTFKFRARSPGLTTLGFTRAQLLDPEAKPVESRFRGTAVTVRPVP